MKFIWLLIKFTVNPLKLSPILCSLLRLRIKCELIEIALCSMGLKLILQRSANRLCLMLLAGALMRLGDFSLFSLLFVALLLGLLSGSIVVVLIQLFAAQLVEWFSSCSSRLVCSCRSCQDSKELLQLWWFYGGWACFFFVNNNFELPKTNYS